MAITRYKWIFVPAICIIIAAIDYTSANYQQAHKGCYKENRRVRVFRVNTGWNVNQKVTAEGCFKACSIASYNYAGVTRGEWCFCSNTLGNLQVDSAGCTLPCNGDPSQMCGSLEHLNVYDCQPPIKIKVAATPTLTQTGSQVEFVTDVVTDASSYKLRFDYDNGAGPLDYVPNVGNNLRNKTFYQSGEYSVTVLATSDNEALEPVETKVKVVAQSQVSTVEINCPEVVATFEPSSCDVTVIRGSDMELSVSYTDGYLGTPYSETFPIGDAQEFSMGNPVNENQTMTQESSAGIITIASNPALHSGRLIGFEVYAVGGGQLDIQLKRPSCSGGTVYCTDTRSCETSCSVTCSGPNTYCIPDGDCGTSPVQQSFLSTTYIVAETIPVVVSPGHHFYDVTSLGIAVEPGYVIAYNSSLQLLAAESASTVDYEQCATSCVASSEKHMLKAIYTTPATARVEFNMTKTGYVNFTAAAENINAPAGVSTTVANSTVFEVQEGVNASIIDINECLEANVPSHVSVLPFSGNSASVNWVFGDTGTIQPNTTMSTSYTFINAGTFAVTANISNAISWKSSTISVCVEERIHDVALSLSTEIEASVQQHISFTKTSGSHYTCNLIVTDSKGVILQTQTFTEADIQADPNVDLTLTSAGQVTVDLECSNNINTDTWSETCLVVERLTGLALSPPAAIVGQQFRIRLVWATGSQVNVTMVYDGTPLVMTVDQDGRFALSSEMTAEPSMGQHTIYFEASNPLGTVTRSDIFVIETPIEGITISCTFDDPHLSLSKVVPYEVIKLNSNILCSIDMTYGTSVQTEIDYQDGTTPYTNSVASGQAWPGPLSTTHTFTKNEMFDVTVTVKNSYSSFVEHYPVLVLVPVTGVTLATPPLATFHPPTDDVLFNFINPTVVPNAVDVTIDFGDKNTEVLVNHDLTTPIIHQYRDEAGELTATCTLTNLISDLTLSVTVKIVQPIIDKECFTDPPGALPGVPLMLKWKSRRAPGPCCTTLTFDCGDGSPLTPVARVGISPDGEDTSSCSYPTTGPVTASVTAVTDIETVTCTYVVQVQNPVVAANVQIFSNSPMDFHDGSSPQCDLELRVDYTDPTLPDAATVYLDYGDGTTDSVALASSVLINHVYASDGHFTTTVRIANLASEASFTVNTGCYTQFTGASMVVKREPHIPLNSSPLPGFGPLNDQFRYDEPLAIETSLSSGTFVYWNVQAISSTNIVVCNKTDSPIVNLEITEPGVYDLTLQAFNPVYSSVVLSETITMLSPVSAVSVDDGNIVTGPNAQKEFNITMAYYGSSMCVAVHTGKSDDTNIYLYGDSTACGSLNLATVSGWEGMSKQYDASVDVSQAFSVQYSYKSKGGYSLTVHAMNAISEETITYPFVVSPVRCSRPNVNIKLKRTDFADPMLIKRSKIFKISGVTIINCEVTIVNNKLWTVERRDENTNELLEEIDISSISSRINSDISIPPRFFQNYGLYKFKFKVTMDLNGLEANLFFNEAYTYVKIIKSDLLVQLYGGGNSQLTIGHVVGDETVALDAMTHSSDPDVDAPNELDSFKIACRDVTLMESFPEMDVMVNPVNKSDMPASMSGAAYSGCFHQGPGWFSYYSGKIILEVATFAVDHTYEFWVKGYKDTRESNFKAFLEVKSYIPPSVLIGPMIDKLCWPGPRGLFFNANYQLGLAGMVGDTCSHCTYSYMWEMYVYDHEFCDVNNCWRDLHYLSNYIEGVTSSELTIHTTVFEHYLDRDLFQVRLTATNDQTNASGSAILDLVRNGPPYGGNCSISAPTLIGGMKIFELNCSGFVDDNNDIEDYKITCESEGKTTYVTNGPDPYWPSLNLPTGVIEEGYNVSCFVTVKDDRGAFATYPIDTITNQPMTPEELKKFMGSLAGREDDLLDYAKAVGNLADIANMATAYVPQLKRMGELDEYTVYNGMATVLSFLASPLENGGEEINNRPFFLMQNIENETALEQFEEDRDKLGNFIGNIVGGLEQATAESVDDILIQMNVLESLTSVTEALNKKTQERATALITKAIDNLQKNIESVSVEQVKAIAQASIGSCENIHVSADQLIEFPTNTDLDDQTENAPFFSSNKDSPTEDIAMTQDPAKQMKFGKKSLHKHDQQVFVKENKAQCQNMEDSVTNILVHVKPKSALPTALNSENVETQIYKNDASSLVGKDVHGSAGDVSIPANVLPEELKDEVLVMIVSSKSSGEGKPVAARSVSLSYKKLDGSPVVLRNLATPIKLTLKQDPSKAPLDDSMVNSSEPVILQGQYYFIHTVTLDNPAALVLKFRLDNMNATTQFLIMVSHEDDPSLSEGNLIYAGMVPNHTDWAGITSSLVYDDPYTHFIDRDIIGDKTGTFKVAVRQLLVNELNTFPDNGSLPSTVPQHWYNDRNFTTDYKVYSYGIVCSYTGDGSTEVRYDGVKASKYSTENSTVCESTHLTSFAGGWVVAPNAIDWNFVFANADFLKNPTLYVTEMAIILSYILALIWARRTDKLDLTKLGLAPLLDNDPRDKYYYEIMIETGLRRNGGTESKVHFILSGEEEETDVRTFTDKKRKIFQRGNTDGFLMATSGALGSLMYLRIWHDNSGKGPMASWYLNHILVRDVQTDKKYYFICNRWFAVEEDDGQVDRVIPVAGKEQMTEFSHLFKERAQKNLSDGHLWFSVVARPPQSRFTRCQRVSCCLCLLFTSMLANAMFYESASSDSNAYTFGPFAITPEQIFIGIASNLIIFPVNFLLITLFRKSRPRKLRPSRVEEALKSMPERSTSMTDVNPRVKSSLDYERPGSSFLMDAKRSQSSMSRPESSMSASTQKLADPKKKKKKTELPWWFTVISWILLWITVLVSAFFVTMYGIQFQDMKCKMWITSMLVSFFTSVFLTQPLKVFLFAIIFSLIIKNPGGDEDEDNDEEERKIPDNDEEFLHTEDDGYGLVAPQRPLYKPKPPDSKALESARQQRLKEIQMWAVIREILFYAFFLWILLVISYRSVSTNSYNYKFNMEQVFILTNDTNYEFTKVKNVQDYWVWARSGMLRGLRAGPYYNNFPPFYLRGYINDKNSRLMGYAVLRQVRVRPGSCHVPHQMKSTIDECNEEYDMTSEENRDFGPGWTDLSLTNETSEEYTYLSADTLNGYPYWGEMAVYGGGGYVVRLNEDYFPMVDKFKKLEEERWIDEYTRAVFLEFTVYNPSVNLFAISTLISEYRPSGGVFSSYRFEPCMLLPYMSPVLLFQLICEVIYMAFTLYFVIKEVKNIYKQKLSYFKQFWNLIELGICGMSVTAIVIYFYRFFCINRLTEYFEATHGEGYMKFQYVGYWTELFNYIIGFLVFFASLKFLKLLRFNKKISLLTSVLSNSGKDLIHFSVIFNIVFMAFIQLFYLIYHAHLEIFKTMVSSVEAGIVMMMGKFDIYKMLAVNSWLTQIFLFLFVVGITFIVVNMFLSILNDTFGMVRTDIAKQENDYEIVDFMMSRFKLWTGLGASRSTTISPADMERERNRHYQTLEGKIDYFPDQIDRFLASVSNMYMEKSKFDNFLDQGLYNKMAVKAKQNRVPGAPIPNMANFRHLEPHPRHPGTTRISSGLRGMTDVQTD